MRYPKLSVSERNATRGVMAEIDARLFDAAHRIMRSNPNRKIKIKEVVEYGFKFFVLNRDPKTAARLGIEADA